MRALASASIVAMVAAAGCGSGNGTGPNACGTGDVEGNASRAHATSYVLGSQATGCVARASDAHYFDLAAPGDATGGYVQGSVDGSVGIDIYAMGDATVVTHIDPDPAGGPTTFFLAIAPGEDYQLGFTHQGPFARAYTFTLTTTYTPVADSFEPNDTQATASLVTEGIPITAYLFGGRLGGDATPSSTDDYSDCYRFSAAAGAVTVHIDSVPADVAPRLTLYGPDGSELARVANGLKGGALQMVSPTLATAGDLVIRVTPWSGAPPAMGAGTALPDHFTQAYTLTINQP